MKKIIFIFILLFSNFSCAAPFEYAYAQNGFRYVKHLHSESSYQHAYCTMKNGEEEFELKDKTRVDCLTKEFAIEFDFANKAYEAVGQALHYSLMTDKKPKIVLILDGKKWEQQLIYYNRIKNIGNHYNFEVEYITDGILNLNNGKCRYSDCKCNKNN